MDEDAASEAVVGWANGLSWAPRNRRVTIARRLRRARRRLEQLLDRGARGKAGSEYAGTTECSRTFINWGGTLTTEWASTLTRGYECD